jgi:prephenate dehydratase
VKNKNYSTMQALMSDTASDSGQTQKALRIGIQGYPGAFHEIAARQCFQDRKLHIVPALTFETMIQQLVEGKVMDVALMAIENTLAGSLMGNYRLLDEYPVQIVGEVYLRVKQNLMALPGQGIEDLHEVHSHPIAIEQCLDFFRAYPHIRLVQTEDTALAAKKIQELGLKHVGAIASTLAADMYKLPLLAQGIETNKKNYTRFLVIQPTEKAIADRNPDKYSISFDVDHAPGSLHKVLAILSAYNFNMTKIQSAPIIGRPWEYRLFVDYVAEGNVPCEQAFEAIGPITHDLKLLGAYRQGLMVD